MKILIGGSVSKFFHLQEFKKYLERSGINCNLVHDEEYSNGYPSKNITSWFQSNTKFTKLIEDYKPDIILVDRQRHFALESVKTKIPVLVHLRGDFWSEINWAKETIYKKFPKNFVIQKWEKMGNTIFENAEYVLPICKFLDNKVHDTLPNKKTQIMYQGIETKNWFYEKGMTLKHPCVGLIQSATIWGKTQEMLILKNVLKKFPNITFYWVGDGPYAKIINSELSKYSNFKWLGNLEYPKKIREFLSEIDIYALISGIDMAPLTLLEAQLMKKPVIATSVGGIPELMINEKTGFLVNKGNDMDIVDKISVLINNETKEFGDAGEKFVLENFSWDKISNNFAKFIKNKFNVD